MEELKMTPKRGLALWVNDDTLWEDQKVQGRDGDFFFFLMLHLRELEMRKESCSARRQIHGDTDMLSRGVIYSSAFRAIRV